MSIFVGGHQSMVLTGVLPITWNGSYTIGRFLVHRVIVVSQVVRSKCNIFTWLLGCTLNTKSTLFVLMTWCFRPPVRTVVNTQACVSRCVELNSLPLGDVVQWFKKCDLRAHITDEAHGHFWNNSQVNAIEQLWRSVNTGSGNVCCSIDSGSDLVTYTNVDQVHCHIKYLTQLAFSFKRRHYSANIFVSFSTDL